MVNEVQYIKSGGIDQDRFGGSTLYQCSIKLTQKLAIGINVDNLGIEETETTPPIAGTPMYVGAVTSSAPDETEVKLITSIDAVKTNQTKSYTMSNSRFCFAYPTSFGELVSVLDSIGDEIISGFNITTLDFTIGADTINYTIYTLKSPATVTSFNVQYKFS
jgi:Ca2+-binding RTX toxin-like protein